MGTRYAENLALDLTFPWILKIAIFSFRERSTGMTPIVSSISFLGPSASTSKRIDCDDRDDRLVSSAKMPREIQTAINTAQPTDALTAQPKHGRVLTETVQPSGSPNSLQIPVLISGVVPFKFNGADSHIPNVPIAEPIEGVSGE